jgi:hypothetical protein
MGVAADVKALGQTFMTRCSLSPASSQVFRNLAVSSSIGLFVSMLGSIGKVAGLWTVADA